MCGVPLVEKQGLSGDTCMRYVLKNPLMKYIRSSSNVSQVHVDNTIDPPNLWSLLLIPGELADVGRVDAALICLRNPCSHVTWGFFLFLSLSLSGQFLCSPSEQSEHILKK